MKNVIKIVLLYVFATAALGHLAWAQAVHVDDSATGANDGTSWQNAYTDLQAALAVAGPSNPIWVAAGTYRPSATLDRLAAFTITYSAYGGFDGTETTFEQRAGLFDETILTGDLLGNDGPGFAGYSDNSEHVVHFPVMVMPVLDGFTVRGGNADDDWGGGGLVVDMFCFGATVRNCTFAANFAARGGGIWTYQTPTWIERCTFIGNRARKWGGAVYGGIDGYLRSCRFLGNSAGVTGGALFQGQIVVDCLFSGNTAPAGGGAAYVSDLFNCTFSANSADVGGGLYNVDHAQIGLFNSVFWGNVDASGIPQSGQLVGNFSVEDGIVQGWDGSLFGGGTFDANPLFRSPLGADGIAGTLDDDLRVERGSPCIDTGDRSGYDGLGVDALGRPRFVDSLSCDGGGDIDRGAIERGQVDVDTVFCESTPTSLGVPAEVGPGCQVSGPTLFFASPLPETGSTAFLLLGRPAAPQPLGEGYSCLGGAIRRTAAIGYASNEAIFYFDPRSPPWSEVAPPGATIGIQALFRDPAGGPSGFNLSSAMRLLVLP